MKSHNHTHDSWFSVKQGKLHTMKEDFKPIYCRLITIFLPWRMKQKISSQWVRDTVIKVRDNRVQK